MSAAPALAQRAVPPDDSAVDQYLPSLPVAEGERSPSLGGSPLEARAALPREVRTQLPRGPEGDLLARLAGSPSLGAPSPRREAGGADSTSSRRGVDARAVPGTEADVLSALGEAATQPGGMLLIASLLGSTALMALLGTRRGRLGRASGGAIRS